MENLKTSELKQLEKQIIHKFGKHYLLGVDSEGIKYYLEAPSWDCGWYWGFGYIHTFTNNKNPELSRDIDSHTHWDSFIVGKHDFYDVEKQCFRTSSDYIHHLNANKLFTETVLTDKESWTLAELMRSFYTLKETAEVLGKGSAHITENPCKNIIKNETEVKRINEVVLPAIFKAVDVLLSPEVKPC